MRRRKRRERDQLKPKMDELLSSLPEETINVASTKEFIESKPKQVNVPNATKKTGHKRILAQEHKNFTNVLKNGQFRSLPFAALREAIKKQS